MVFSARSIPGNEKAIGRVVEPPRAARRGRRDVGHQARARVGARQRGGTEAHAVARAAAVLRPDPRRVPAALPLRAPRRADRAPRRPNPVQVLLVENGDRMRFDASGGRVVERVATGRVLIDGPGIGEVGDEVLRDRRHLAEDGLVVPVLAINKQTGGIEGVPDVITRGLVLEPNAEELLREAGRLIAELLAATSTEERTDPGLVKEKIRAGVAPVLPEAFRPAAAGTAGDHGDIASGCRFDPVPPAVRVPGRRAVCAGADLAHRARHLRSGRPGVVLPRRRDRRPLRTSSAGWGRSSRNSRSRSWASRRSSFPVAVWRRRVEPVLVPARRGGLHEGRRRWRCSSRARARCSTCRSGRSPVSRRQLRAGRLPRASSSPRSMAEYFNRAGSIIVILTLLVLAIILATQFSFGRLFSAAVPPRHRARGAGGLGRGPRLARGQAEGEAAAGGDPQAHGAEPATT